MAQGMRLTPISSWQPKTYVRVGLILGRDFERRAPRAMGCVCQSIRGNRRDFLGYFGMHTLPAGRAARRADTSPASWSGASQASRGPRRRDSWTLLRPPIPAGDSPALRRADRSAGSLHALLSTVFIGGPGPPHGVAPHAQSPPRGLLSRCQTPRYLTWTLASAAQVLSARRRRLL